MAAARRRRRLSAQRRHALQLLAGSQSEITETFLFAHGVTQHMLARLLSSGLATIQRAPMKSPDGRVMITDAGRQALEAVAERRPPLLQLDE
jgi:DNA-binding MarR family transcriptional regulator